MKAKINQMDHEKRHKELLLLMDNKKTTGNTARATIDFFRGNEKIGTTVISWGKIIYSNKC